MKECGDDTLTEEQHAAQSGIVCRREWWSMPERVVEHAGESGVICRREWRSMPG
ncbi:MAG: hypothetical protein KDC99_13055 [Cyclobacteriaceae bacterium]|nr:hypothetical protein [Cyclobacteriaceae bacterium]